MAKNSLTGLLLKGSSIMLWDVPDSLSEAAKVASLRGGYVSKNPSCRVQSRMGLDTQDILGYGIETLTYAVFGAVKSVPDEAAFTDVLALERNLSHCAFILSSNGRGNRAPCCLFSQLSTVE